MLSAGLRRQRLGFAVLTRRRGNDISAAEIGQAATHVVEATYLTWTDDNFLRQVSYQGQREDKCAREMVRAIPHLLQR
jgi:hypothetical protein